MDVNEFIEQLVNISEKISNDNNWVKKLYLPLRRSNVNNESFHTIESLFNLYDLSNLGIGWFNFYKNIEYTEGHIFFGFVDANFIGINNFTGEIDYVDCYTYQTIYKLSPNLNIFLSILILIAKFSLKGLLGEVYSKRDSKLLLSEINKLFDENEYIKFYYSMYGNGTD